MQNLNPEEANVPKEMCVTRGPAQVFLQPIAPPSILGLYGFAGATFIVAAGLAGWYATSGANLVFPFAAIFGGVAQFLAGMWCYRARDGLGTAMHGMWGSFWMGYGILFLLVALHAVTPPTPFVELGYWFIPLAVFTATGAVVATAVNWGLFWTLATLAAGSASMAYAQIFANTAWTTIAGYWFIIAAILAWYTATGLLLEYTFGRSILPLGPFMPEAAKPAVDTGEKEPGVMQGQ